MVFRIVGGENLLVPTSGPAAAGQKIYVLNRTAAAMWEVLEEPATLEALAGKLADEFAAPVENVRNDIEPVILQLASRGLVKIGDGGA